VEQIFLLAEAECGTSNYAMRAPKFLCTILLFALAAGGCISAKRQDVVNLLQPENFYSYIEKQGVGVDPDQVFTWHDGMLHISGQHYGYLATKQTNFSNYKLVAEFKWGNETWAPRKNNARDGGVLVHGGGKDMVWPRSIEAQLIEGGTGDVLVVNGAYLTVGGKTLGPKTARFDRPGRNPWKDELGFRGPNEIEKPHGRWNRLEILCDGDRVKVSVNGHTTIDGTNASPTSGKIVLQSEGAEIFFRRVDLYPLN
jgi:hypothetical protein